MTSCGVVLLETSVAFTKYGSVLVMLTRVAPPVFSAWKTPNPDRTTVFEPNR